MKKELRKLWSFDIRQLHVSNADHVLYHVKPERQYKETYE